MRSMAQICRLSASGQQRTSAREATAASMADFGNVAPMDMAAWPRVTKVRLRSIERPVETARSHRHAQSGRLDPIAHQGCRRHGCRSIDAQDLGVDLMFSFRLVAKGCCTPCALSLWS